MELRDYQEQCVRLTVEAIGKVPERGFHYVLPTGTGKTEVAQQIIAKLAQRGRVLCIAHTRDLIHQTAHRLSHTSPDVGVVMAEENQITSRVVVGSIQTLTRGRFQEWLAVGDPPSLVWIDECHHVTAKNRYGALLDALWELFPECPVLGCTATDFRTDGESFQELLPICTFSRTIAEMQQAAWLAPTVWYPIAIPTSFADIKKGFYQGHVEYDLDDAAEKLLPHTQMVVEKTIPLLGKRPTVVFCANVKHAQEVARCYLEHGMTAACVWGDMPRDARLQILGTREEPGLWQRGDIQTVPNVGVLTEGFDFPNIAAVVNVCPTMSPGRYLQKLGRGTRLKTGRYQDCLVIDVCDNSNLLDTKQVCLPKVQGCQLPDTEHGSVGELVEALAAEEEELVNDLVPSHVHKPRSVRLGAWENVSWARWGWDRDTNCYYVGMGNDGKLGDFFVAILPDPKGSGLWYPFMFSLVDRKWKREKIIGYPVKLNQVMQHVNQLIARAGLKKIMDKNASWQMEPASTKQIWFLGQLDQRTANQASKSHWTKGEVSLAITWAKLKPAIMKTLGKA